MKIQLANGRGVAIVDDDFDIIEGRQWCINGNLNFPEIRGLFG